jgi:hypothetical protein
MSQQRFYTLFSGLTDDGLGSRLGKPWWLITNLSDAEKVREIYSNRFGSERCFPIISLAA